MGWTRKSCRATLRPRRPDIEALEPRKLLTTSHSHHGARHGHAAIAPLTSEPSPTASSLNSNPSANSGIIGAAQVRSQYGVDGTGSTVAVIDTGVNYKNTALGGGLGAGFKVVTGYDFTQNSNDPMATDSQHGTAVAGLIASSGTSDPGVAPGADIAALKVFGSAGQGNFNYVAEALQWVVNNHSQYNITAVNLSMSDGNNYPQNWFAQDGGIGQQITQLIGQLDTLNIPVIAATGNSFTGQQGEGFPSIVPDTISVTSTNAAGTALSSDAQRLGVALGGSSATDIAAPGEGLIAPVVGNKTAGVSGTSFAAAEVSGAVVLLQQIYESRFGQLPTVDQLDSWLQGGSDPVGDPVTGLAIGRLDIPNAASLIPSSQPPVPSISSASSAATPGSSAGTTLAASTNVSGALAPWVSTSQDNAASIADSSSPPVSLLPAPSSSTSPDTTTPTMISAISQAPSTPPAQATDTTSGSTDVAAVLTGALKSLSAWGGAGGGIWSNLGTPHKILGSSQPSGQIKPLALSQRAHHPQVSWGTHVNLTHSAFVRKGHHR
jgi:type VI secretion system secreted protein VgrG